MIFLVIGMFLAVVVGGYWVNRDGHDDLAGDPEVKKRRNNWVP